MAACACQKIGSCQGSYEVGGFACLEVVKWWKKDLTVLPAPGKTKSTSIKKVLEVKIRDDCTTYCGQKNGTPVPGDALIPALVH